MSDEQPTLQERLARLNSWQSGQASTATPSPTDDSDTEAEK
ncbi:hypothetical protein [Streptosporangium jomthongense]|uniref:Uncharacterized protein n=1 Tax=Streptosporangium jomthongense TaxID=1193683 RepID=A0ABV8F656_9ACTN